MTTYPPGEYSTHKWGPPLDDEGKLLSKNFFPEGARLKRRCVYCGCIKYVTGPSAYLGKRKPYLFKDIKTHFTFLGPKGLKLSLTERPNCIPKQPKKMPVSTQLPNSPIEPFNPKAVEDQMVLDFKATMDKAKVNPANILEGIRKTYIVDADKELAELAARKEQLLTLKHNLSK